MKTKYVIGDSFKYKEGKEIHKITLVGSDCVQVFDNDGDDWVLSKNYFEGMLESGEVELIEKETPNVELQIGTKVNIDGEDYSVFKNDGVNVGLEGDSRYLFVDRSWLYSQLAKNDKPLYQKGTNFMNREATIFVITKITDDEIEFFGNGRYNSLTKTCFDESLERGHLNICEPLNDEHSEDDISELFELDTDNKEQNVIKNPSHYTFGKYECLDVAKEIIKEMNGEEGAMFFNAFKYLWRYKHKNGLQDLKKCEFYLKELIKLNKQGDFENKVKNGSVKLIKRTSGGKTND